LVWPIISGRPAALVLALLPEGRACLDVCRTLLDHKLSLANFDSTVCIASLGYNW
jgi:hypothetical protein